MAPHCRFPSTGVVIFCDARLLENVSTVPEPISHASGREELLPKSVEILGGLLVVVASISFAPTFSVPKHLKASMTSAGILGLLSVVTPGCSHRTF